MSRFKRILDENNRAINKQTINPNSNLPLYGTNGKVKINNNKISIKKKKIGLIILGVIIGFIYIPQFFISDKTYDDNKKSYEELAHLNIEDLNFEALSSSPQADFDKDGLTNETEKQNMSNKLSIDTDGDGVSDYYEYYNGMSSNNFDDLLLTMTEEIDKVNGASLSSPYKMNNVILWADNYQSKAYGGVIETTAGYRFTNFTGYAQFPNYEYIYAYEYKNGVRTELEFLENEKAWRIDGNMTVEIYSEPLEEAVKFNFFGATKYVNENPFFNALAFILPDKGFVTASKLTVKDTEPDTRAIYSTIIQEISYDEKNLDRFKENNTNLSDLVFVRDAIKDDTCIAVSLKNIEYGYEYIGIIYGYTFTGDLLVADANTLSPIGTLKIEEKARKIIDNNGNIVIYSYYDFEGLGFNSITGDNINFFAASKTSEAINNYLTNSNNSIFSN